MVKNALQSAKNASEREPLLALESELQELINLTKESLDAQNLKEIQPEPKSTNESSPIEMDDEYALFMVSV